MNVVISSAGSLGDVLPYVAIGAELRRRGHVVTLVANPTFERLATEAAIGFTPVGTLGDHQKFLADGDLWEPERKSLENARVDHYYPHLLDYYQAVLASSTCAQTVIVTGEVGGMTVAEKLGIPFVHIVCAPAISPYTRSRYDPPHPERLLPTWARWFAGTGRRLALLYKLNDLRQGRTSTTTRSAHLPAEHPIAHLRTAVGLAPLLSFTPRPRLSLCMWPDWFAAPQRDWPEEAVITGFPFYPRPNESTRLQPRALTADMSAPIVVTTGSVAGSQFLFYETAVEACSPLGRPVLLVSPHRDHIPLDLPSHVQWVDHAPFSELFGRASLVLHHGGIGTVSYALASGVPQIVMPMRWDQFDNGNRLQRLGVGKMLARKDTSPARLTEAVKCMLGSRRVASRCHHWQSRVDPEAGIRIGADAIEASC